MTDKQTTSDIELKKRVTDTLIDKNFPLAMKIIEIYTIIQEEIAKIRKEYDEVIDKLVEDIKYDIADVRKETILAIIGENAPEIEYDKNDCANGHFLKGQIIGYNTRGTEITLNAKNLYNIDIK
jgi:hypothetical protein